MFIYSSLAIIARNTDLGKDMDENQKMSIMISSGRSPDFHRDKLRWLSTRFNLSGIQLVHIIINNYI